MQPELWIFDLDGTIVDVRNSTREAVRRTVQAYFSHVLGLRGTAALVTLRDVQTFKLAGGLNNGWDLSSAIILYLLSLMGRVARPTDPGDNFNTITNALRQSARRTGFTVESLRRQANFEEMATRLHEAGGGLDALTRLVGGPHPLLFNTGELRSENVVQRLFQEFYLGRRLYATLHRSQPFFYKGPGLFENERLLIPRAQLEALAAATNGQLALATNRPLAEIRLALEHHGLMSFFKHIVAHEDVRSEAARAIRRGERGTRAKPHPFMLLEAAEMLDPQGKRPAVYIGDTPDDILAAQRAAATRPFVGWGAVWGSLEPERLRQAFLSMNTARILETPEALMEALTA